MSFITSGRQKIFLFYGEINLFTVEFSHNVYIYFLTLSLSLSLEVPQYFIITVPLIFILLLFDRESSI